MTSGWVCLAVDPQNDATLKSDRKFRSVPLRLFSPSAEATPAFIGASFSSICALIDLGPQLAVAPANEIRAKNLSAGLAKTVTKV
jgi:hypothetical protein